MEGSSAYRGLSACEGPAALVEGSPHKTSLACVVSSLAPHRGCCGRGANHLPPEDEMTEVDEEEEEEEEEEEDMPEHAYLR